MVSSANGSQTDHGSGLSDCLRRQRRARNIDALRVSLCRARSKLYTLRQSDFQVVVAVLATPQDRTPFANLSTPRSIRGLKLLAPGGLRLLWIFTYHGYPRGSSVCKESAASELRTYSSTPKFFFRFSCTRPFSSQSSESRRLQVFIYSKPKQFDSSCCPMGLR